MQQRPFRIVRALGAAASACLLLAGCSASSTSNAPDGEQPPVDISISAAASLQRSFNEIAKDFSAAHPEYRISGIAYDGSSTLATQIVEGAAADVFASADQRNMDTVIDAGLGREPAIFATNTLVIAVPKGNPAEVESLQDLAMATTVLCAPQVPCGSASQQLLENQDVSVQPASEEQNVTAVLQKVAAGEADAGLVYATDVAGDDSVDSIVPEGAADVVNSYPIAVLGEQPAAQAFVDYVLAEEGQQVLAEHGFGPAPAGSNG